MSYLVKSFLAINNPMFGLLLLILICLSRQNRVKVILLMFTLTINLCLNVCLKAYFKMPLHAILNNPCWWSFPSGHTQYGLVFWTVIGIEFAKLYITLPLFLSSLIAMNYSQYHTWYEISGAFIPGLLIIVLYLCFKRYLHNNPNSGLIKIGFTCLFIQLLVLYFLPDLPCQGKHYTWLWFNLGLSILLICISRFRFISINSN
jgi:membrane-associated phospholipid phosphatase